MIKHVDWNVLWTFHALHVLLFFPQSIFSLMLCLVKIFSFHLNPTLTSLKEELKIQSISHLNDQKVILSLAPHQAFGHVFINPDFWTRRQPDRFSPCFLTRAGKKTCVKKKHFRFWRRSRSVVLRQEWQFFLFLFDNATHVRYGTKKNIGLNWNVALRTWKNSCEGRPLREMFDVIQLWLSGELLDMCHFEGTLFAPARIPHAASSIYYYYFIVLNLNTSSHETND